MPTLTLTLPTLTQDEIDQMLEETAEKKSEYDDWLAEFAAQCRREGRAMLPAGIARQRAWNAHQKAKGLARKQERARERIQKLILRAGLDQTAAGGSANADAEEPDFAAIEAAVAAAQEKATHTHAGLPAKLSDGKYQSPASSSSSPSYESYEREDYEREDEEFLGKNLGELRGKQQ